MHNKVMDTTEKNTQKQGWHNLLISVKKKIKVFNDFVATGFKLNI